MDSALLYTGASYLEREITEACFLVVQWGQGPRRAIKMPCPVAAHSQLLESNNLVLYRPHAGSVVSGSAANCQPR
jgi:hypothetical protein